MIARLLLGLASLTGALVLKSHFHASSPGAQAKAGDEVAVPLSALPGLNVPPGAGGAILAVETAGTETLLGRVVAFQGPGGTADVRTPIGPLVVSRKDVSIVLAPPADRVGRFADVGDDVAVDVRDPAVAALTRAQIAASAPSALLDTDKIATVLVHVEKMGPKGLSGVIRGFSFTSANGNAGIAALAPNAPTPAGNPQVTDFSRGAILGVSRAGVAIAARAPAPRVAGAIVGSDDGVKG